MTHTMAGAASRTDWVSRLVLALTLALVLGTLVVPEADASKKTKNAAASIKDRLKEARADCEGKGGTYTIVSQKPGGTTTTCKGASSGGQPLTDVTCTEHSKGTRCHASRTSAPSSPQDDVTAPPTEGGNEAPTGSGGGNNTGGGAAVPPSGGVDPTGGGPAPVLE